MVVMSYSAKNLRGWGSVQRGKQCSAPLLSRHSQLRCFTLCAGLQRSCCRGILSINHDGVFIPGALATFSFVIYLPLVIF